MSKKIPTIVENADGWSDWIAPKPGPYRMVCCDCGLAHDLEFKVVRWLDKPDARGMQEFSHIGKLNYGVIFRASRNERSTAQFRRFRKYKEKPNDQT